MKENMKVRSLFTYILALLVCVGIDAKTVELGKGIIYEGEVLKGVPNGNGTITLRTKDYNASLTTPAVHTPYKIKGRFDGNTINDAKLYECSGRNYMSERVIQSGTFRYEVKDDDKLTFVLELNCYNTIAFQKKDGKWKQLSSYSGWITEKVVNGKAKKKKIKYSNTILYQGLAIDNTTMGNGSLVVNSLVSKGNELVNVSGDFNDGTVHEATVLVNGGMTISAKELTYKINVTKEVETVHLFMRGCKLTTHEGLAISDIESLEFGCHRPVKMSKEWFLPIKIGATSTTRSGYITSNFLQVTKDLSIIDATPNDISKQRINFELVSKKVSTDEILDVKTIAVSEIVLNSGVIIKRGLGATYNYPNGNTVYVNGFGTVEKCKVVLNGGVVEKLSDGIVSIKYENGDVFSANTDDGFKVTSFIGSCKSVSELRIVNGELSHSNKTIDTYSNGEVISTSYPLSDGGSYIKMKNGLDVLVFADGRKFEASTPNGIIAQKEYSPSSSTTDYTMSTGTYTNADGHKTTFENGNVIIKNIYDITAYPIDRWVGELGHTRGIYLNHRLYDGSIQKHDTKALLSLVSNDAAGYFGMENIKTELQKKAFTQTEEYKSTYLPRLQAERNHLYQDEYIVRLPIKAEFKDLDEFKYDMNLGRFLFEVRDTENKKINEGCSDFHILFYEHLCLTYPRSLVSMTSGKSWLDEMLYVQNAQTGKVSESDALKVENNLGKCEMVWVFKFEKVKDSFIYGKTTRIYIANEETGEIYCDLSNSLGASQASFKSTKVIKDNTPKKVYHSKGKVENCGLCLGTGKGWGTPTCPNCGGKGWYIEHYW